MKKNKLVRFIRRMKWLFGVYLGPNHVSTIMTWNGLLSFYSKDRTLGRSLHVEREFEREIMKDGMHFLIEKNYLNEGGNGIVLDVGGYIGMSSIGFVNNGLFSGGVAFEPNPNNFLLLEKNIKQNNLESSIKGFNIALSDRKTIMKMELSDKNYGDHRLRDGKELEDGYFGEHERKVIDVESITLDEFLSENKEIITKDIKLVWMDIQGSEGHFLSGAKHFFINNPAVPVFMEFTPYLLKRMGMGKDKFCNTVEDTFKYFYIFEKGYENKCDIKELRDVFEKYDLPTAGTHLILVN